jgi:hypothetical protein
LGLSVSVTEERGGFVGCACHFWLKF